MIKPWLCLESRSSQSFRVFSVRTDIAVSPRTGKEHDFYVIECRDWINVIPLTENLDVVMVRQYRHGSRKITLEIPGGLVDAGDTPIEAAARELLEETGYTANEWLQIGDVSPNPALFNNRCYTFLARQVRKVREPVFDHSEDIETILVPISEIPRLLRNGQIDHALVVAAFYWYFSWEKKF